LANCDFWLFIFLRNNQIKSDKKDCDAVHFKCY
jgi:hypothetical protein